MTPNSNPKLADYNRDKFYLYFRDYTTTHQLSHLFTINWEW